MYISHLTYSRGFCRLLQCSYGSRRTLTPQFRPSLTHWEYDRPRIDPVSRETKHALRISINGQPQHRSCSPAAMPSVQQVACSNVRTSVCAALPRPRSNTRKTREHGECSTSSVHSRAGRSTMWLSRAVLGAPDHPRLRTAASASLELDARARGRRQPFHVEPNSRPRRGSESDPLTNGPRPSASPRVVCESTNTDASLD